MKPNRRFKKALFLYPALPFLGVVALAVSVSGVLGPALQKQARVDPSDLAINDLTTIAKAFRDFHEDMGEWPLPENVQKQAPGSLCVYRGGCSCLFARQDSSKPWQGPSLRFFPPEEERLSFYSIDFFSEGGMVDPWGQGYQVFCLPPHEAWGRYEESISAVCTGPNGELDTSPSGIAFACPSGDDLIVSITQDA